MRAFECCICGELTNGFGNNAQPIKEGRCCDDCDERVIVERIKKIQQNNHTH